MKPRRQNPGARACGQAGSLARNCCAGLALVLFTGALSAQTATPAATGPQVKTRPKARPRRRPLPSAATDNERTTAQPRSSDRRRATKLYLAASKLFLDRQFEEAMKDYEQAAVLDPDEYELSDGSRCGAQPCGHGVDSGGSQGSAAEQRGRRARCAGARPRARPHEH